MAAYARLGRQKEVADELGLSIQTVKNHMANVLHKLGVESSVEAYSILGWLQVPGADDYRGWVRLMERTLYAMADHMTVPDSSLPVDESSVAAVTPALSLRGAA